MTGHPGVAARPAYTLSKMSGTLLFQVIAQNVSPEKLQIINVHPGAIYSAAWKDMGLPPKLFDHGEVSLLA
jgi:NAD(P)-dependent dehydrogenase (short-subunit alcohol dehydrogenase family)